MDQCDTTIDHMKYMWVSDQYSQTCFKRPLKGSLKSGLLKQEVS